jgi:hypothetical protein
VALTRKERIEALTREVRDLKEALDVLDRDYAYLADLVNDAACRLKEGQPIDDSVLDEIIRYERKSLPRLS